MNQAPIAPGTAAVEPLACLLTATPVEQVAWLPLLAAGVYLYLKREDMLHPTLGGNKLRKLITFLKLHLQPHHNGLATAGGPHSNHLLAVATAGRLLGLPTHAAVYEDTLARPSARYLLAQEEGMRLHPASRRPGAMHDLGQEHWPGWQAEGLLWVPIGIACEEGVAGMADLGRQLQATIAANQIGTLACTAGTGTMAAGLWRALHGLPIHLHVFTPFKEVAELSRDIREISGVEILNQAGTLHIHPNPFRLRFGKIAPEEYALAAAFLEATGIPIETTYQTKLIAGLQHLATQSILSRGTRVLAIHCGGAY